MTLNTAINQRLQRITRRAERVNDRTLGETFVAVGGVENILFNPENQILFGRRGTGKTHALRYLQQKANERGEAAVYLDLRTIGSNTSIYSDASRPIGERITTLVIDVCGAVREALLDLATSPGTKFDLSKTAPRLDALVNAISKIYVDTDYSEEASASEKLASNLVHGANIGFHQSGMELTIATKSNHSTETMENTKTSSKGQRKYTVHFGTISSSFQDVCESFNRRLWILLDEWSAIPEDLQPYLADVIRRCFFPLSEITVLLAAIEFRSVFQVGSGAHYTGIEVGADCSAAINFDDFMVFENNPGPRYFLKK
jgi:hypothetical protein